MSDPATHACSEGCTGFRPVPGNPWSNFGVCRLPQSPQSGFPVLVGSACTRFVPRDYSVEKLGGSNLETLPPAENRATPGD